MFHSLLINVTIPFFCTKSIHCYSFSQFEFFISLVIFLNKNNNYWMLLFIMNLQFRRRQVMNFAVMAWHMSRHGRFSFGKSWWICTTAQKKNVVVDFGFHDYSLWHLFSGAYRLSSTAFALGVRMGKITEPSPLSRSKHCERESRATSDTATGGIYRMRSVTPNPLLDFQN